MATLKDLSKHLDLSVTQVSRALNDHADVSEDTKKRVTKAARELGYTANISARKLKSGRSGIVAMVVAAEEEREMPDVLLAGVIGLSAELSKRGMQFVLHVTTDGDDPVATHRKLCGSGLIDGFLIVNPAPNDARIGLLRSLGVPFAVHGRDADQPDYPYFDVDNHALGFKLTEHLLSLGHRRIALIDGPAHAVFAIRRAAGFQAAYAVAGVEPAQGRVLNVEMTAQKGEEAVATLFEVGGDRPTALIAGNTMIATGIYTALAKRGLSIPDDVSVVAHDDGLPRVPIQDFRPSLTATTSPLADAWGPIADALATRLTPPDRECRQVIVTPELSVRASSATC
ncbi:LacI family DNA-binding transcriptional regulator [Roseobacter sinensis]|uniref:Substrate-binding domain-containing protein n=1 Tax=Roseobacter sinensis TaxID=2931391 RepID=A0ABT3BJK4_9RHOB|nr:substrate-binding domain-containing protein [Roseobacter sp. WL0113]MCV3273383.1 substrate-binding domain-containing protein [Roseobacter sp. WL0113]